MQDLPIGIQTFSDIREDNYLYVDKTDLAQQLIKNFKFDKRVFARLETEKPLIEYKEDIGCFPAGTRIMTDKGVVPIEQIQVGDKVLSKPEDGTGEPAFKPVVRTMTHEDKELWELTYVEIKPNTDISKLTTSKLKQMSMKGKFTTIKATPNHPFWIEGVGWTRLDHLEYGQIIHSKKEKMLCMVFNVSPVYATNIDNVVAQSSIRNILDADKKGQEIEDTEYYNFPRYGDDGYVKEFVGGEDAPSPLLTAEYGEIVVSDDTYTTTVYNFEVADFHTYYVWDLWVHNDNCDGAAPLAKKEDLVFADTNQSPSTSAANHNQNFVQSILNNVIERDTAQVIKASQALKIALQTNA